MKYYRVQAKCGHVRRGHYIVKDFFVKAEDGKEAAYKVRFYPRVKHDWKHAIISVKPINLDEYKQGCNTHKKDLYFHVTNSSDQRLQGVIDYELVFRCEEPEIRKKDKDSIYYNKLARIQRRDLKICLAEII